PKLGDGQNAPTVVLERLAPLLPAWCDAEEQAPADELTELGLRVGPPEVFAGLEGFDGAVRAPLVAWCLERRDESEQGVSSNLERPEDGRVREQPLAHRGRVVEVAGVGRSLSGLEARVGPIREGPDALARGREP